jgi:hypothetical protein
MQKLLLLSIFLSLNAMANEVPSELRRNLKPYATKSIDLKNEVLRVTMDRPMVTPEIYRTIVVGAVCGSLWTGKGGWGAAKIERAEVLNNIGAQGFAMTDLKRTCDAIGTAKGDEYKPLLERNTVTCVVGECRKR